MVKQTDDCPSNVDICLDVRSDAVLGTVNILEKLSRSSGSITFLSLVISLYFSFLTLQKLKYMSRRHFFLHLQPWVKVQRERHPYSTESKSNKSLLGPTGIYIYWYISFNMLPFLATLPNLWEKRKAECVNQWEKTKTMCSTDEEEESNVFSISGRREGYVCDNQWEKIFVGKCGSINGKR